MKILSEIGLKKGHFLAIKRIGGTFFEFDIDMRNGYTEIQT
jgi:hypothetical protein